MDEFLNEACLWMKPAFPAGFIQKFIHRHFISTQEFGEPNACVAKNMLHPCNERWGAGVETQKNVRGEVGGWGRVPFHEPYAPSLSTIYDGA